MIQAIGNSSFGESMNLADIDKRIQELTDASGFEVLLALMSKIEKLPTEEDTELVSKYLFLMRVYTQCRIHQHRMKVAIRDYGCYPIGSYGRHNNNLAMEYALVKFFSAFSPLRSKLESELLLRGINPKEARVVEHRFNPDLAFKRIDVMKHLDNGAPLSYNNR